MCRSKAANIGIIMAIFHLSYPWLQTCPNQIIPVNEPNCRHGPATQQWKRTSQPLEMFVRISIWMTCAWDGLAGSDGYSFAPRLGFWFYFNSILATSIMIGTEPYISWFHSNICIYHSNPRLTMSKYPKVCYPARSDSQILLCQWSSANCRFGVRASGN